MSVYREVTKGYRIHKFVTMIPSQIPFTILNVSTGQPISPICPFLALGNLVPGGGLLRYPIWLVTSGDRSPLPTIWKSVLVFTRWSVNPSGPEMYRYSWESNSICSRILYQVMFIRLSIHMIKNTEAKVTAAFFFFFAKIYVIKMNESIIYLFFFGFHFLIRKKLTSARAFYNCL